MSRLAILSDRPSVRRDETDDANWFDWRWQLRHMMSNPTRIESRFFKHSASPVGTVDPALPANPTNLLAGHGVYGWTDIPDEN